MSSVFKKPGREQWYARIKGAKKPGKWSDVPTNETDRTKAERFAAAAQKAVDKRNGVSRPDVLTLSAWVRQWLVRRAESGHDWKKDKGRLENHVLSALGGVELADITTAHLIDLVHELRFKKHLANRTVRNVYTVICAVMRDAVFAMKIQRSPCILNEQQLGPIVDKDPEWRASAIFTRDEVVTMISDARIPLDRRVVYALGLLAGLRPGEGAALRWRNYDATREPLGMLTVAKAYSTTYSHAKGTKTEAVKFVPVHPVLARLLTQWRSDWATMFGSEPAPDDLIVPLPPDVKRTRRTGERFRGWDYTGKRWRELDLPTLGWRHRSVYDTRATFITLAIEDGADRAIIRERVTHTKSRRDAFDGYDRGERWAETCREVAKLKLADGLLTDGPSTENLKLRRRVSKGQPCTPVLHVIQGGITSYMTACDYARAMLSASLLTDDTDDKPMAATPT